MSTCGTFLGNDLGVVLSTSGNNKVKHATANNKWTISFREVKLYIFLILMRTCGTFLGNDLRVVLSTSGNNKAKHVTANNKWTISFREAHLAVHFADYYD